MDDWRSIARIQFGLIEYEQALRHGVSRHQLSRMVKDGELEKILPRVYRAIASPRSWNQELMAACLWAGPGAVLSHRSAAVLLGLDGVDSTPVEVTLPRYMRAPKASIQVHRARDLRRRDVCRVGPLPLTTMPRTIIDLATCLDEYGLDLALDSAVRKFMRRSDFLQRFSELSSKGRSGIAKLGRIIAERGTEQGVPDSAFERQLVRVIKRAGLPLPVCQFPFLDGDFRARIDFAYPEFGIAIEADGYRWHDGRVAFERDRARYSELASRGWRVLTITWLQLKYEPEVVVTRVARALATPPLVAFRAR